MTTLRRLLPCLLLVLVGGCALIERPAAPFAATTPPAAPDYALASSWLALPGDDGLARSTPSGIAPVDEARAEADVFFIHPTTSLGNDVYNAPLGAGGAMDRAVLANQASAFNGCCRIFAPRYRQASLRALNAVHAADDLAYEDVSAAFDAFLARIGDRPFIIAGHSQGASLGARLVEERIAGTGLARRLVAAYLPGTFLPASAGTLAVPACATPTATGCVVTWNTSEDDRAGAAMLMRHATYRLHGTWMRAEDAPGLCVDPLGWTIGGTSQARANPGSLPLRTGGFGRDRETRMVLPDLVPSLTGAACGREGALIVHVSARAPSGFHDIVAWLTGSYHLEDYNLFWASIRRNAIARVASFTAPR